MLFSPTDTIEDRTAEPDAAILVDHILVRCAHTWRAIPGA